MLNIDVNDWCVVYKDNSSSLLKGLCLSHVTTYLQDLPGDKATQWDDFVSNALAEVNRKNEITPLPVRYCHYFYGYC